MKNITKHFSLILITACAGASQAVEFNFSGNSGSNGQALSAKAKFTVSGINLTIVLTNTASAAANDGANVLDGVYFDITGSPVLTNGNAALTVGSNLVKKYDNSNHVGNPLNNEWYYKAPISNGANWTAGYGIGCTGFPSFNVNNNSFDKVFHSGSGTGGANDDYGIVPTLGIDAGNPSQLYARNSMTFTFTLSSTVAESAFRNIRVSYGSNGQTQIGPVPEPATMAALGLGAVALIRRRRKNS